MEDTEAFLKASLTACVERTVKSESPPGIERGLLERVRCDCERIAQRHRSPDAAGREFLRIYGVTEWPSGNGPSRVPLVKPMPSPADDGGGDV